MAQYRETCLRCPFLRCAAIEPSQHADIIDAAANRIAIDIQGHNQFLN